MASNEKNVPLRKVMGRRIKLLKAFMSSWELAVNPISSPRKANVRQDKKSTNINIGSNGLNKSFGDAIAPAANIANELIRPLITPIRALPKTIALVLIGAIKSSSKHL